MALIMSPLLDIHLVGKINLSLSLPNPLHYPGGAIALLDSVYLPLHISGVTFKTVSYGLPRVGYISYDIVVFQTYDRRPGWKPSFRQLRGCSS